MSAIYHHSYTLQRTHFGFNLLYWRHPHDLTADELPITYHFLLSFTVKLTLSICKTSRLISYRNTKSINPTTLTSSINSSCLLDIHSLSTPDDLVSHYNTRLYNCLDSLTPLKTRSVSFTVSAPWFTPDLRLIKARGRQLERLYRKTGLTIHKERYNNHFLRYKDSINTIKTQYYSSLITANQGNSKLLFSTPNPRTLSALIYTRPPSVTPLCHLFK